MTDIIKILKKGGVGVLATDTLYGVVASAFDKKAVERIYFLKKRNPKKPLIILVSSFGDLNLFKIKIEKYKNSLKKIWPGKVSVILPCDNEKFNYLHRDQKNIAFRMPDKKDLLELLEKTGPLVAPSVNLEGEPPAKNIKEAKKYFGDSVDFYLDEGELDSLPSTLISFDEKGNITIQREGAVINQQHNSTKNTPLLPKSRLQL
jgi:L-threonylcarbamoyladenylate synthase